MLAVRGSCIVCSAHVHGRRQISVITWHSDPGDPRMGTYRIAAGEHSTGHFGERHWKVCNVILLILICFDIVEFCIRLTRSCPTCWAPDTFHTASRNFRLLTRMLRYFSTVLPQSATLRRILASISRACKSRSKHVDQHTVVEGVATVGQILQDLSEHPATSVVRPDKKRFIHISLVMAQTEDGQFDMVRYTVNQSMGCVELISHLRCRGA